MMTAQNISWAEQGSLKLLKKHLGTALQVVQRLLVSRKLIPRTLLKAPLQKPVRGLRGQHEYAVQTLAPGFLFQLFQQSLPPLPAPVIGVRNNAGHLTAAVIGERI